MKFTYLTAMMLVMFLVGVNAADHWICTCFRPDYDRGCCANAGGVMMEDGNVCDIPGHNTSDSQIFKDCCTKINGTIKCKTGY